MLIPFLFPFSGYLPRSNVGFQTLAEIQGACYGVDNGADDEDNCDDSERCERSTGRAIVLLVGGLVDSSEFKDEVGESAVIQGLGMVFSLGTHIGIKRGGMAERETGKCAEKGKETRAVR